LENNWRAKNVMYLIAVRCEIVGELDWLYLGQFEMWMGQFRF